MAISDSELIAIESGRQFDLTRVGNSIGSDVNPYLTGLSKYVREVLFEWEYLETESARNEAVKLITTEVTKELSAYTTAATVEFNKVVAEEVAFQYAVVKGAVGKTAMRKPTIKDTKKLINKKPMVLNGEAISVADRIGDYAGNQSKAVESAIIAGWSDGLTTRQIAQSITGTKTIKGVFQRSQNSAYQMSRDVVSHISAQSKAQLGEENQDIIIGEKAVVTLDSKTSPICQKYGSQDSGGKEFYYKEDGRNFPRPPYHRNCRSTMTFILADEYRSISDEGNVRPAIINGKSQLVDASTDWMTLAKKYPSFGRQSLGKTKAKMLDNMSAKEFTEIAYNRINQPLTIDQLAAKSVKAADVL